jgi:hypothetical protein
MVLDYRRRTVSEDRRRVYAAAKFRFLLFLCMKQHFIYAEPQFSTMNNENGQSHPGVFRRETINEQAAYQQTGTDAA